MKKTVWMFVAIAVLAGSLAGQEVVIRDNSPFAYAYLEFKGLLCADPRQGQRIHGCLLRAGLTPVGNFFGMYLNSPGEVKEEDLQWRLGFPVAADATVAAPLLKGECRAARMAACTYVGPYEKVNEAYGKVFAFIVAQGYEPSGPIMERYLDMDPMSVKPEALRTEINVPVEKK